MQPMTIMKVVFGLMNPTSVELPMIADPRMSICGSMQACTIRSLPSSLIRTMLQRSFTKMPISLRMPCRSMS